MVLSAGEGSTQTCGISGDSLYTLLVGGVFTAGGSPVTLLLTLILVICDSGLRYWTYVDCHYPVVVVCLLVL